MINKLEQILSLFTRERPSLSAAEISSLTKRPKSSTYRILKSAVLAGFLDYDQDNACFRLGIRLAALGSLAQSASSLQRLGEPVLRTLSDSTGELADLNILVGDQAVTVAVAESFQTIMIPGLLGGHPPLHATAAGKVLLAHMPETRLETFLTKARLQRFTERTITDRTRLAEELANVGIRGYATSDGEWVSELVSIGAPVRDHRGDVAAAIAVGWPRHRMSSEKIEQMRGELLSACENLSRALGYAPRRDPRTTALVG